MKRTLLIVTALLGLVLGVVLWSGRGRGSDPGTPAVATTSTPPASTAHPVDRGGEGTRKDEAPAAPAPPPVAKPPELQPDLAQPRPGADVRAIFGGEDAFAGFYRDIPADGRRSRLQELESTLAQYTDGDPSDPREFQKYQALKDEAEWLRVHLEN